jgi:hypothetical protein
MVWSAIQTWSQRYVHAQRVGVTKTREIGPMAMKGNDCQSLSGSSPTKGSTNRPHRSNARRSTLVQKGHKENIGAVNQTPDEVARLFVQDPDR